MGFLALPSMLDPREIHRTDGRRPGDVTINPWEMGKQLALDDKVLDALAIFIKLKQGSPGNPRTTATEAEAQKM